MYSGSDFRLVGVWQLTSFSRLSLTSSLLELTTVTKKLTSFG